VLFRSALARAITFWRPYRSWEDLLLISDVGEAELRLLQTAGFAITPPNDAAWAPPKRFKLSAGSDGSPHR
jgi:hypothetical protein